LGTKRFSIKIAMTPHCQPRKPRHKSKIWNCPDLSLAFHTTSLAISMTTPQSDPFQENVEPADCKNTEYIKQPHISHHLVPNPLNQFHSLYIQNFKLSSASCRDKPQRRFHH
jgi:hypothetical protein